MSYLVSLMPAWLNALIAAVCFIVLVCVGIKLKRDNKIHNSRAILILSAGFAAMSVFAITKDMQSVPGWLNWSLLIAFAILILAFITYGFIIAYKTMLKPGKQRKTVTVCFVLFMAYFVFVAVGVTIHALTK